MIYTLEVTTSRDRIKSKPQDYISEYRILNQQEQSCYFFFSLIELLNELRLSELKDN